MKRKYGLVRLSRVMREYKDEIGYSSITMSHVDALGRGSDSWELGQDKEPKRGEGETRQGLTRQTGRHYGLAGEVAFNVISDSCQDSVERSGQGWRRVGSVRVPCWLKKCAGVDEGCSVTSTTDE